jgi:hypothetical protein
MNPTRLRKLPANTGTADVSPASRNAFTQSTIECGKLGKMAFDEGGRDARDPSIGGLFKRRRCGRERCASILGLLLLAGAVVVCVLLLPFEALGRVGGGQSYGGGGSHGGGSGGSGDAGAIIGIVRILFWLTVEYPVVGVPVDIAVVGFVVYRFARGGKKTAEAFSSGSLTLSGTSTGVMAFPLGLDDAPRRVDGFNREFAQLRKFDPNFSEIVFTDFCYALYGKAHDARGHGQKLLDQFSPYLSEAARKALLQRNPTGLKEVKGIIVGAMSIVDIRGLDTPLVEVSLLFESNYTEVVNANGSATEMTYYVRERWQLERKRDVLSPAPAQATALHCPKCGAPLQKDTVGACAFCGTKVESGEFQWYVRAISLLSSDAKGPLLTSNVPEVGTNLPSVVQAGFREIRLEFEKNNPSFSWGEFQARARLIFDELQAAWSTLDWERARPHETDNLFQMHQYWIDAYKRQHLRNVLDQCRVTALQPVKIKEDAFYISITLRIGAQGYDYTADERGNVVSGSKTVIRHWSEYWTFIRSRKARPRAASADLNCPNCAAPLRVNNAGVCEFCGGKITSGEFDWVLSRIEQDESYRG